MPQYFDAKPQAEHQLYKFTTEYQGRSFRFETDSAMFSRDRIDFGSDLLLRTVLEEEENTPMRVLDLGSGYGPIAIVLKALKSEWLIRGAEINERALEQARHNAKLNRVAGPGLEFCLSEVLDGAPGPYEVIITNPPVRAGKTTVFRFFAESHEALTLGGKLYVVLQRKQGADSAEAELKRLFGNVENVARKAGFRILRAVKNV